METFLLLSSLILSLFLVIKSADYAIRYSTRLAKSFALPSYVVGFLVIAVISILPEGFIAVTSALEGVPSLGLGTLFGSNVADLSLIFALLILVSGRNLKIESKIIKDRFLYLAIICVPILIGLDGFYSKIEGIILVLSGMIFYFYILKDSKHEHTSEREVFSIGNLILLLLSMACLLWGAYLTVKFGVEFANYLQINPILVGMFVIGLGTTLPELFFSMKAVKNKHDDLALGDVLGTVVADATIVVGVMAIISPFAFNPRIIYVTGVFMLLAIALLMHCMKTERTLSKKEALLLVLFYLIFVWVEFSTGA